MNRVEACNYLRSSGFSDEQIKVIEGAFTCEDAISRQAVLNVVEKAVTKEVARWSIKELPSVNPQKPCEPVRNPDQLDCVNRQAVLDAINTDWHEDLSQLIDAIKALPPVEPKQKMGHWIKNKYGQTVCSECQACALEVETGCWVNRHLAPFETKYCSQCGAKMSEGSEKE